MNDYMIMLGMSGGVDSGTAAALLLDEGHSVMGATLVVSGDGWGPALPPVAAARAVADALGIDHVWVDCRDKFDVTVKRNFIGEYAAGRTPNPCVVCNRSVKFPHLFHTSQDYGCLMVATGHYARTVNCGSRMAVAKGKDPEKDQSYMLWSIPWFVLCQIVFPLGEYTKAQVREIARERRLPCAETKESQDICFIPDGDYVSFLAANGVSLEPGTFVDTDGNVLGPSKNQVCYTIGQRRCLGIACGKTMYVTAKDAEHNVVTIAPAPRVCRTVTARRANFMAGAPEDFDAPRRLAVRLRYTSKEYPCYAERTGEKEMTIRLDDAVRAPACGQSAVLYDGDVIAAGGIIEEVG